MAISLVRLRNVNRLLALKTNFINALACHSDSSSSSKNSKITTPKPRYKIFQDEDSPVILDVGEEQRLHRSQSILPEAPTKEAAEEYSRGATGVFDIEELVLTLKKDNAQDIFVVKVPPELKYVDFLVIVTGHSKRHLLGLAEYVRNLYKKKRQSHDIIPRIEGKNSSEWIAMDLGNIALHIMSKKARECYDLESLWALGGELDSKSQEEDNRIFKLLLKHSILLDDIQPLKGG